MIHCLEGGSHQIHLLSFVGLGSLLVEEGGAEFVRLKQEQVFHSILLACSGRIALESVVVLGSMHSSW